ncbi:MAG: 7,8-dihydro-8-oxoguanine-triphosphatase [Lachnospiraceae bacterium]|nr:7,8-dihydro-8-oxoguanine-triphosphatase [Lachnospiraceae bacterium]
MKKSLPFVEKYYKKYTSEYIGWVIDELCDIPLEFIVTWEDYHDFEHILDKAYQNYCA